MEADVRDDSAERLRHGSGSFFDLWEEREGRCDWLQAARRVKRAHEGLACIGSEAHLGAGSGRMLSITFSCRAERDGHAISELRVDTLPVGGGGRARAEGGAPRTSAFRFSSSGVSFAVHSGTTGGRGPRFERLFGWSAPPDCKGSVRISARPRWREDESNGWERIRAILLELSSASLMSDASAAGTWSAASALRPDRSPAGAGGSNSSLGSLFCGWSVTLLGDPGSSTGCG